MLTLSHLKLGIARLNKQIEAVERLRKDKVAFNDSRIELVSRAVQQAVGEVFGRASTEFHQPAVQRIWDGPRPDQELAMMDGDRQEAFEAGVRQTVATLRHLVAQLAERSAELAADPTRTAFGERALHPRIAASSESEYRDGRYDRAVLAAATTLMELIREKSGSPLDGLKLIQGVFGGAAPALIFNALASDSDKNEQKGLTQMLEGAWSALRNPRAHGPVDDSPELTLDYLALLSLLARRVDAARKRGEAPQV